MWNPFSAIGKVLGTSSNRDNAGTLAATNTYNNAAQASNDGWNQNQAYLNNVSNNINATNYQGGAQDAYGNQVDALNTAKANYGQQQTAAGMLYNQATGQAASAADIQMQQGLGTANNQAQSAAYSQQGGVSPGLTQRNMLGAQAAQNASIVGQGSAMRAQEQQAAQAQYANQLQGMGNQANAMGQTAAGMTSMQNQLGQEQYNQAQTNLGYLTQSGNQANQNAQSTAQNIHNSTMQNLDGKWAAQKDQTASLGNTLSSAAMMAAGKPPSL